MAGLFSLCQGKLELAGCSCECGNSTGHYRRISVMFQGIKYIYGPGIDHRIAQYQYCKILASVQVFFKVSGFSPADLFQSVRVDHISYFKGEHGLVLDLGYHSFRHLICKFLPGIFSPYKEQIILFYQSFAFDSHKFRISGTYSHKICRSFISSSVHFLPFLIFYFFETLPFDT